MATSTPWGPSQQSYKIAHGITRYHTAGHGGIKLSPTRNAQVPMVLRLASFGSKGLSGWYEEDCDVAIVVVTFPEYFTIEQVRGACRSLHTYRPAAAKEARIPLGLASDSLENPEDAQLWRALISRCENFYE